LFRADELTLTSYLLCGTTGGGGTVKKGTVVWVTGMPGSGKSSFLRAAGQSAFRKQAHIADGKCFLAKGARVRSWNIVEQLVTSILGLNPLFFLSFVFNLLVFCLLFLSFVFVSFVFVFCFCLCLCLLPSFVFCLLSFEFRLLSSVFVFVFVFCLCLLSSFVF
jgi:hypothetical protein